VMPENGEPNYTHGAVVLALHSSAGVEVTANGYYVYSLACSEVVQLRDQLTMWIDAATK
jgi:hypothetical protein